ncbi:uncharacterized protein LOC119167632 isoform X2 [Rhipicephalus microplus]|uniref:uncharacterized protein LOC119167632 isoform X2 n=1 Tax=Rhipicephalus microplus TaxID=6941 RepID=UPI003F6D11FE
MVVKELFVLLLASYSTTLECKLPVLSLRVLSIQKIPSCRLTSPTLRQASSASSFSLHAWHPSTNRRPKPVLIVASSWEPQKLGELVGARGHRVPSSSTAQVPTTACPHVPPCIPSSSPVSSRWTM